MKESTKQKLGQFGTNAMDFAALIGGSIAGVFVGTVTTPIIAVMWQCGCGITGGQLAMNAVSNIDTGYEHMPNMFDNVIKSVTVEIEPKTATKSEQHTTA